MKQLSIEEISTNNLNISSAGILTGLNAAAIKDLESKGVYMEYEQELVAATGQDLKYFFYIVKGKFEVSKVDSDTGKKVFLANISEGECFGEMSFFTSAPASANVIAQGKVTCWAIPHETLREFILDHKGGTLLAINIGSLLALRVQESNSRIIGMTASLSAYFGHQARTNKKVAVPKSGGSAEMEIPDDVFDVFVRQCLKLDASAEVTDDQRAGIRTKIERNELDIVPWLENGKHNQNLKMRLKLVDESQGAAKPFPKRPSSTLMHPTVLRIPQVRASLPGDLVKKSAFSKFMNVASYAAIPLLGGLMILLLQPLEKRVAFIESPVFKAIPGSTVMGGIIVRENVQPYEWIVQKGAAQSIKMGFPKPVLLSGNINFPKSGIDDSAKIHVILQKTGAPSPVVDQVIGLSNKDGSLNLFNTQVTPGEYVFQCDAVDFPDKVKVPTSVKVTARS